MDNETIRKLAAAPISFIGSVRAPGGGDSIALQADELEAFCADPEGFYALKHSVTKDEYLQWVETERTPRCGALNTKGMRCGNLVSGGIQMRLERWLQEDGGFCSTHGGATSSEARMQRQRRSST